MAKLSLFDATQSQLEQVPRVDGQIVVVSDTGSIYKDVASGDKVERVPIGNDIIIVNELPLAPIANKIYFLVPDKLYIYDSDSSDWVLLNSQYTHPESHRIDEIIGLNEALKTKVEDSLLGAAGGVATLDDTGKIPQSQLPNTSSAYETIIINTTFDEDNGVYKIDEASAELLRGYAGEKTMYLYEPLGQLYIPYIGNNEFVIDVFGASIYFRVDLDTLLCEVSVGEWVSLDENGEISEDKIPSIIVHGYYNQSEGLFYEEKSFETLIIGNYKKFFVDISNDALYSYYKGKYYPITTIAGDSGGGNVEYITDEEYEEIMGELGI